jgi:hypothetical protein
MPPTVIVRAVGLIPVIGPSTPASFSDVGGACASTAPHPNCNIAAQIIDHAKNFITNSPRINFVVTDNSTGFIETPLAELPSGLIHSHRNARANPWHVAGNQHHPNTAPAALAETPPSHQNQPRKPA